MQLWQVSFEGVFLCEGFTHRQELPELILEKLLELRLAQLVGVSFSAGVLAEGFDEEGHGLADVRHPGSCFQTHPSQ